MSLPALVALDAAALRGQGIPAPWAFGMADRVRFSEIDALNHVNHTACLRWFESLRVHYLSAYGITRYAPQDPRVVLREITCRYDGPLFLNDSYIVTARCARLRQNSFTKEYAVWVDGAARITGRAVVVLIDASGRVKQPLSAAMRQSLIARDGALPET